MKTRLPLIAAALAAAFAAPAAADMTPEAEACIDELRARMGNVGGEILGQEFSEAATMVRLRDSSGAEYECLVWSGPEIADFRRVGGEGAMADDGGGAMAGAGPGTTTQQVRFEAGASGAAISGVLTPGSSARYVLGAREGQFLTVRVDHRGGPRTDFQVFNPDGSFLLEMIPTDREYRGQLWQSGEHVVEVINRGGAAAEYEVTFEID